MNSPTPTPPTWQAHARRGLTRALLAFVLISIGYAIGTHTRRSPQPECMPTSAPQQVIVTYLHGTSRCKTCNTIESMTRSLLTREFSTEIADGRVEVRTINYEEHENLAQRWGISASCVVVSQQRQAIEAAFTRLDEVWRLMKDPPAFDQRLSEVIRGYLPLPDSV